MNQKYFLTVHDLFDIYEVLVEGNTIRRVTRYLGDSQVASNCNYETLSDDVKNKICNAISEAND